MPEHPAGCATYRAAHHAVREAEATITGEEACEKLLLLLNGIHTNAARICLRFPPGTTPSWSCCYKTQSPARVTTAGLPCAMTRPTGATVGQSRRCAA